MAFQTAPTEAQSAKWLIHMGVLMGLIPNDGGDMQRMRRRMSVFTVNNGQDCPYGAYDWHRMEFAISEVAPAGLAALRWAQVHRHALVPEADGRAMAVPLHRGFERPSQP